MIGVKHNTETEGLRISLEEIKFFLVLRRKLMGYVLTNDFCWNIVPASEFVGSIPTSVDKKFSSFVLDYA
jgi:hypothetical protein